MILFLASFFTAFKEEIVFLFLISQPTDFICISLFFSTNEILFHYFFVLPGSHVVFDCHVSLILSNL